MIPIETPEDTMDFSKDLLETAKKLASSLSGDNVIALPVGEQPEALWISLNPDMLAPIHSFKEGGRTIHIGLKKETT